jgi:hypothetical protein
MKKCLFISFFVLTLFLSVCVYAQDNSTILSLDVKGSAEISRNDAAHAREEAIQNAIETAILRATAKLMAIPLDDDRFKPVKSVIIDETNKYVNNYKIVAEMRKPTSYEVSVHVVVNLVNLKNDLNKMGFLQVVQAGNTSSIVMLEVKGLEKYSDFVHLKEFLQSRTKIVKNIYPCRAEWQQAHFEIEIIGDAQYLAGELTKTGRYALNSGKTGNNKIEMSCLQKKEDE